MRILGVPIEPPQTVVNRMVSDVAAIARAARLAPAQLERMLELGVELVAVGRNVLVLAERLDQSTAAIMELGERLNQGAVDLLELGTEIQALGERIDARGAEIVDRATRVADTGDELITVLPAFERALEMATPLEGAIDRFGRLVDRLPGGAPRRRLGDQAGADPSEEGLTETPDRSTDRPADPASS